ncbi:Transmembrane_domain-containing protein [Hexamita inflata]|uniref:Transmembrane domain-containing protein n=1 Tax=Hexamita inflata TaxID=28002 RepID=A0AA86RQ79_9EUKA|nr:Transmembrane domain-containing protein [Hexamita inflata]
MRPTIKFFNIQLQFIRGHNEEFLISQDNRFRQFLNQVQLECGQITPGYPQTDQKDIYWTMQPIKNDIYKNIPKHIFEIRYSNVEGYMELQTTELLQLLSIYYKISIDVSKFVSLLKYNSLPEKCIASLELFNILKPTLTQEEAMVAILVCLTQRFQREGFDDNYNIMVQHVFSKIYNDRSPNQRAAMSCAWSVITEMNLVDQKYSNLYFQAMICGDTKMYESIMRQLKSKEEYSILNGTAWLLAHSPQLIRDSSHDILKVRYEQMYDVFIKIFHFDIINYEKLSDVVCARAAVMVQHMAHDIKSTNGIYL